MNENDEKSGHTKVGWINFLGKCNANQYTSCCHVGIYQRECEILPEALDENSDHIKGEWE